jgi:hypothetical protein
VDLTHDTVPETKWRPIEKFVEKVPPVPILNDRVLLRDWELDVINEHSSFGYDRRQIDQDVFRRMQAQGEIIRMAIDQKDLNRDGNFWREEEILLKKAQAHLKELR